MESRACGIHIPRELPIAMILSGCTTQVDIVLRKAGTAITGYRPSGGNDHAAGIGFSSALAKHALVVGLPVPRLNDTNTIP